MMTTVGAPAGFTVPRSTAERWAVRVLRASESDGDLKTIAEWARYVGVSYTSLCESCRLLSIRPQDARDFTRILRVLIQSRLADCQPEALLDVGDRRTLNRLTARAGIRLDDPKRRTTLDDYLCRQRFVEANNQGLTALRKMLNGSASL